MQFFRSRTIEGGVQIELDLDSAKLLYQLTDAAAVTDKTFQPLDGLAKCLRHTLIKEKS
jgi:hypothetical protein